MIIVTCGQSGVAEAALAAAARAKLEARGLCHESGFNDNRMPVAKMGLTPTHPVHWGPTQACVWHTRASRATLVLCNPTLKPIRPEFTMLSLLGGDKGHLGSVSWQVAYEERYKPHDRYCVDIGNSNPIDTMEWLRSLEGLEGPFLLHVAGPDEREAPGIGKQAFDFLSNLFELFGSLEQPQTPVVLGPNAMSSVNQQPINNSQSSGQQPKSLVVFGGKHSNNHRQQPQPFPFPSGQQPQSPVVFGGKHPINHSKQTAFDLDEELAYYYKRQSNQS